MTTRASAYELWMKAPNPMVTFFKTIDVTNLLTVSRKRNMKFNMLLCFCIAKAAVGIEEFYTLPVSEKLLKYDKIAVSVIVKNKRGEINSCDIPYAADLETFNQSYLENTASFTAVRIISLLMTLSSVLQKITTQSSPSWKTSGIGSIRTSKCAFWTIG